jgi:hypothetical protein
VNEEVLYFRNNRRRNKMKIRSGFVSNSSSSSFIIAVKKNMSKEELIYHSEQIVENFKTMMNGSVPESFMMENHPYCKGIEDEYFVKWDRIKKDVCKYLK